AEASSPLVMNVANELLGSEQSSFIYSDSDSNPPLTQDAEIYRDGEAGISLMLMETVEAE
ncbi:MAG: hypothetical protein Q7J10_04055, partial [Methanosarcinaceae archaeon]|nr:hypothetical protein [Methanosarcinaceae archaeon]